MGLTKAALFSEEQNSLATIARALSHPARVAIIQHLLRVNSCITGDIVDAIPLAQPTVSRHLRDLKEIGLIKGTIEGVRTNYCIDRRRWEEVRNLLNGFFLAPEPEDRDCG